MTLDSDGVSFEAPPSYTGRRDHGVWVLSSDDPADRSTIAIKTSPNDAWAGDLGRGRPAEVVVPATEATLKALPGSQVGPTRDRKHSKYLAFELSAQFEPTTKPGTPYRRDQVVLLGKERVIHVVLTRPASEPGDVEGFNRVIDSLREEG